MQAIFRDTIGPSTEDGLASLTQGVGRLRAVVRSVSPGFMAIVAWLVAKQVLWITFFEPDLFRVRTGAVLLGMSLGFSLLLVSPAFFLAGRRQVATLFLLDFLLTLVGYADLVHYRQFRDLTSIASLRYASQIGDVGDSVLALLHWTDAWMWMDVALLGVVALLPSTSALPRLPGKWLASSFACGLGCVLVGFSISPRLQYVFEGNAYLAGDLGIVGYHVMDASKYLLHRWKQADPTPAEVEEAREFFTERTEEIRNNRSPLRGVGAGKNVIVVQLESIQDFVLDFEREGIPLTPEARRLARESIRFEHFFSQSGKGSTADAEFASACSLLPMRSGAVFFEFPNGSFLCLPEILRRSGYSTHAFHANRPDFWNRAAVYPHLGYERFHSSLDYDVDEVLGLGLSDVSFFRQTAEKLTELPRPFYAFVNTLTSHHPFDYPELPLPFDLGRLDQTMVGGYLRSAHYTDAALGRFVEDLRRRGILEESILLVYGDHAGLTRLNSPIADLLGIPEDQEFLWGQVERRVPLIVRLPGAQAKGVRQEVGGQIDLAPTVLALLGIEEAGAFFLGRDLLAEDDDPGAAIFYRGSAMDDRWIYLSTDDSPGGEKCVGEKGQVELDACDSLREEAQRLNVLSRSLLERDLSSILESTLAGNDG